MSIVSLPAWLLMLLQYGIADRKETVAGSTAVARVGDADALCGIGCRKVEQAARRKPRLNLCRAEAGTEPDARGRISEPAHGRSLPVHGARRANDDDERDDDGERDEREAAIVPQVRPLAAGVVPCGSAQAGTRRLRSLRLQRLGKPRRRAGQSNNVPVVFTGPRPTKPARGRNPSGLERGAVCAGRLRWPDEVATR